MTALHDGFSGAGKEALAFALTMLISVVVVWNLYGAIWGEEAQKCFVTGLAVGLAAAGLLTSLAGIPLGGVEGKTKALILFLAAIDFRAVEVESVEYCLKEE